MGDAALVHGDLCASLLNNPLSTGQPWVVFSWGFVVGLVFLSPAAWGVLQHFPASFGLLRVVG